MVFGPFLSQKINKVKYSARIEDDEVNHENNKAQSFLMNLNTISTLFVVCVILMLP